MASDLAATPVARPRIISDPPLLVPVDELLPGQADGKDLESGITDLIGTYRRTLATDRRFLRVTRSGWRW